MAARFFVFLFVFAPSLARLLDPYAFGAGNSDENAVSESDWDSEQTLDIEDRSIADYDAREALPFKKYCEIRRKPLLREPGYEYKPLPMDVTCAPALGSSRYHKEKEFCVIKHQQLKSDTDDDLCQTIYKDMPIFRKRKGSHENWSIEMRTVGVGCKCRIALTNL